MLRRKSGNEFSKSIKGIGVFAGLGLIGIVGNIAITPEKPTVIFPKEDNSILSETLTGKKGLKEQHQKEKQEIENQLIKLKAERELLISREVSRGNIDRYDDRQEVSKKDRIIQAISKHLGGVFTGKSEYIYTTSKAYNVNPMLIAAISKFETANGTSKLVKQANNPGGLNWFKGCQYPKHGWYQKFPTLEVGIEEMVRIIKKVYIDQGHGDIVKIGRKYAPIEDERNGIGGMDNSKWSEMVTKYYIQILNESEVK